LPRDIVRICILGHNLLRSQDNSPPNITFLIQQTDGTVLNSYTTGSIALQPAPLWRQFGFYFSTPPGVSTVVIVMRNNSAGGAPANDIALDDITFRPCGPDVAAWVAGSAAVADTVCAGPGRTVTFEASVSSGYAQPHYQWQVLSIGTWQDIPGETQLTLTINSAGLSPGTFLYRLAVGETANYQFSQCLVHSNIVTLVAQAQPVAAYGVISTVVCANSPVMFRDSSQATDQIIYDWDFGDGSSADEDNPSHLYSQSGDYHTRLIITTSHGCCDTATLDITVTMLAIPEAAFTVNPTDTSIYHPTIYFRDEGTGGSECLIDWGDGTVTGCITASHDYTQPGTYLIMEILTNGAGCTDTAFATVIIRSEYRFFMPNAFTPDGDGLNDIFRPVLFGVYNYNFYVFNRFGQQIFETNNPETGWDGTFQGRLCPGDTYVYKITYSDAVSTGFHCQTGSVILLR
jgi:gliding motility-associated-like protein